VDLSHLQTSQKVPYSLFPGQIVALQGMNASGRKFNAHAILDSVALPAESSTVQSLVHYHYSEDFQNGQPLSLLVAAGPFTTSDNLNYTPLVDLLDRVQRDSVDVVILMGPFVDLRQPHIQSGHTLVDGELLSYEALFTHKVAGLLEQHYDTDKNPHTQFVLVPSVDDAISEGVYPQCPLQDRLHDKESHIMGKFSDGIDFGTLGLRNVESIGRSATSTNNSQRMYCVSNPCTLQINEVVLGITSTDVLFHMNGQEINAHLEPGTRLGRIAQHMLLQRSYYPLFPPAPGVHVDWKFRHQFQMCRKPDILVTPSMLMGFARTVSDGTLVVNPGHLVKDTTGGTYAMVEVHPMKRDVLDNMGGEDVQVPHSVQERSRIEIVRI
jgi:DNA polymerase alpha subunit B